MADATLEHLLRLLNDRNEEIREEGKRAALQLPPERLLQLAQLEEARYRLRKRLGMAASALVTSLLVAMIVLVRHFNLAMIHLVKLIPLAFVFFLPKRGRRSVVELVKQSNDVLLLGPALEMRTQTAEDAEARQMALDAVKNLLPQVRADHITLLTPGQRAALVSLLDEPLQDKELALRVLKALEQIGGAEAIPAVKSLAVGPRKYWIHDRRIKEAAAACLPYLSANAERIEQRQTLLRASAADTLTTPDVLLRPAMPMGETTAPAELLRAASPATPDAAPSTSVPAVTQTVESVPKEELPVTLNVRTGE
jgi:hypothetical protein